MKVFGRVDHIISHCVSSFLRFKTKIIQIDYIRPFAVIWYFYIKINKIDKKKVANLMHIFNESVAMT